jgi:hypothetical protein
VKCPGLSPLLVLSCTCHSYIFSCRADPDGGRADLLRTWVSKTSSRIWRGSYAHGDWQFLGKGAWKPRQKPKRSARGSGRRGNTGNGAAAAAGGSQRRGGGRATRSDGGGGSQQRKRARSARRGKQGHELRRYGVFFLLLLLLLLLLDLPVWMPCICKRCWWWQQRKRARSARRGGLGLGVEGCGVVHGPSRCLVTLLTLLSPVRGYSM